MAHGTLTPHIVFFWSKRVISEGLPHTSYLSLHDKSQILSSASVIKPITLTSDHNQQINLSVWHTMTDSFNNTSSGVINTFHCEEISLSGGDFSQSIRMMQLVETQPSVHHMPPVRYVAMSSGSPAAWINVVTNIIAASVLRIIHLIKYLVLSFILVTCLRPCLYRLHEITLQEKWKHQKWGLKRFTMIIPCMIICDK